MSVSTWIYLCHYVSKCWQESSDIDLLIPSQGITKFFGTWIILASIIWTFQHCNVYNFWCLCFKKNLSLLRFSVYSHIVCCIYLGYLATFVEESKGQSEVAVKICSKCRNRLFSVKCSYMFHILCLQSLLEAFLYVLSTVVAEYIDSIMSLGTYHQNGSKEFTLSGKELRLGSLTKKSGSAR